MDPQTALTTNIVLVALSGMLAGCFLAWALLPSRSERRALRWSENADLPLQESPIADRIVARLRQDAITAATGAAVGVALGALGLLSPVGKDPDFPITFLLPIMLTVSALVSAAVGVRAPLFAPDPLSRRVARTRALTSADYLGVTRRAIWLATAILSLCAAIGASWLLLHPSPSFTPGLAVAALVIGLLGVSGVPLVHRFERMLLERAQPASTPIELAWDDLFRISTLHSVRIACAAPGVISAALVVTAITGDRFLASQIIVWSLLALQLVFPTTSPGLPARLRPRPRLQSVPAGSSLA